MHFRTVPVIRDGEVVLLDMYVDDEWHGSRRTQEQCDRHFAFVAWQDEMIRTRGQYEYERMVRLGVTQRLYRRLEAQGQLGLINAWLEGRAPTDVELAGTQPIRESVDP